MGRDVSGQVCAGAMRRSQKPSRGASDAALRDLAVEGGKLTQSLLGAGAIGA